MRSPKFISIIHSFHRQVLKFVNYFEFNVLFLKAFFIKISFEDFCQTLQKLLIVDINSEVI